MKKHVPEGVVSKEQQFDALLQVLAGNHVFGRTRGQSHLPVGRVLEQMLDQADSPRDFCAMWDQFTGDLRVLGNMLAKHRREGWTFAEEELLAALWHENHVLPGETVPIHETTPITIFMLDPERMLTMIKWRLTGQDDELHAMTEKKECKNPLLQKLFDGFPSFEGYLRSMREESLALIAAVYRDVIERFPHYRKMSGRRLRIDRGENEDRLQPYANVLMKLFGAMENVAEYSYGFLVFGEQDDVLRPFSRKQQKQVATWQLHVPSILIEKARAKQEAFSKEWRHGDRMPLSRLQFGFFPEREYAHWVRMYPSLVSSGVSHGLGVIMATGLMRQTQLTKENFPITSRERSEELRFWMED
jgi:hypothetical protein